MEEVHHGHTSSLSFTRTLTEAKRRTIQSLNHLEWAWSVLNGYPVLTCFELGPLPAPAASQLWRASDEKAWTDLYIEWLWRWKDGSYKMVEFFYIEPKGQLDRRSELWLSEVMPTLISREV